MSSWTDFLVEGIIWKLLLCSDVIPYRVAYKKRLFFLLMACWHYWMHLWYCNTTFETCMSTCKPTCICINLQLDVGVNPQLKYSSISASGLWLKQVLLLIPVRKASEYYLHHPAWEISSYRGLFKQNISMELNSHCDMQIYVVARSELIKIREECIQKKSYYV